MSNQKNLMAYFNNQSKFNKEEEQLRTCLKNNTVVCKTIDINHVFPDGALPIHYACLYNSTKYFTKSNLPLSLINVPGGTYGSTPMMFTIYNSNYKILLSLLQKGADIFKRNTRFSDVLSFCVRYDDVLGLIMVLSFNEKSIYTNRYIKYSYKRNSELTRNFLIRRKDEIEGKEVSYINKNRIFSLSNIFWCAEVIFWVFVMINNERIRFGASLWLFLTYFSMPESRIPLVINAFYSAYASYFVVKSNLPEEISSGIVMFHFLYLLCFYFIKTPYLKINKIKDVKSLISNMVVRNEYKPEMFCLECLNKTSSDEKHIDGFNRCISGFIFNCPLLYRPITSKNGSLFTIYSFFLIILYIFGISENFHLKNYFFYEFLICLFLASFNYVTFYKALKARKIELEVEDYTKNSSNIHQRNTINDRRIRA